MICVSIPELASCKKAHARGEREREGECSKYFVYFIQLHHDFWNTIIYKATATTVHIFEKINVFISKYDIRHLLCK